MKNANHVLCKILDRPWKDKKFCFKDDLLMKKPDVVDMKIINNKKTEQKPSQIISHCYLAFICCWLTRGCTKVQPENVAMHHYTTKCIGCAVA